MPSEKELRALINELTEPVLNGKITTKKEFLEKQTNILDKLNDEYKLFIGYRRAYPFKFLTEREQILWRNVGNGIFIKEAIVFFYCLWEVKNLRKDLLKRLGISSRMLKKHKIRPAELLQEYKIIRRTKKIGKHTNEKKLKERLKIHYQKYLDGEYETYKDLSNATTGIMNKLEDCTLSQALEEFGHETSRKTWKTRSGPWLENHIVNRLKKELEEGTYTNIRKFQHTNTNPTHWLRKRHYTTVVDAVIKTTIKPKHEVLPYLLDYLVHTFLEKRIIKASEEEIEKLPRELSANKLKKDKFLKNSKKRLIIKTIEIRGMTYLVQEMSTYLDEIYKKLKEKTPTEMPKRDITEFLKEILGVEEKGSEIKREEVSGFATAGGGVE